MYSREREIMDPSSSLRVSITQGMTAILFIEIVDVTVGEPGEG